MRERRWILFAGGFLLIAATCPSDNPAPDPPASEPPPFFQFTRISNATPSVDETVEVEWQYGQDIDPGFEPTVKRQVVQLQSLSIAGDVYRQTFGCFPPQLVFYDPDDECLDLEARQLSFEFRGPVMLWFMAWDTEPEEGSGFWREQRVVKFRLPGTSFQADIQNLHSPALPQMSLSSDTFVSLDFDRVFGIYELPDDAGVEDGVIDELGPGTELAPFFPSVVESLTEDPKFPVFFARSTSPREEDDFALQRGSNFPLLPPQFLGTLEGQTFQGIRDRADIVIFAGTIGVYGDRETHKTDRGEVEVITPDVNLFRPVFVQLDLRSAAITPPVYLLSDLHAGNLRQGLVFSRFHGQDADPAVPMPAGSIVINVDAGADVLVGSGSIKDIVIGYNLITEDGVPFNPAQARVSAEWSGVPIYPDDDIAGLEGTYVQFSPP